MKIKIIIVLLISAVLIGKTSAQITGGIAYYELKLNKKGLLENTNNKSKTLRNRLTDFAYRIFGYAKDFSYKLSFNQNSSFFDVETGLEPEYDSQEEYFGTACGTFANKFYQNSKDRYIIKQKVSFDKLLLIKDTLHSDWEITNERKMIGKFMVIKAHKKCANCFDRNAIAWFAPKIPFSFGPAGYGGLPGLILEIRNNSAIYRLKKIKFLKSIKINSFKPGEQGELISKEKYRKMLNEWKKELKKYYTK